MSAASKKSGRARASSSAGARGASWLRNNWTESETREVMEILVAEFITSDYTTAAYSKSHAPDARFQGLSFDRPPRELYNKVQNLRQRFFTPHSYLLRWAAPNADARSLKRAEKCLMNPKTRDSIHGIFAADVPEAAAKYTEAVSAQAFDTDPHARRQAQQQQQQRALDGDMFYACDAMEGSASGGGSGGGGGSLVSVKSVNYYCDIFRRQAPALWERSVEAYRLFLSNHELQSAMSTMPDSDAEQSESADSHFQSKKTRGRGTADAHAQSALGSPPLSLASSSIMQTPTSAILTDFGLDFHSDATDDSTHEPLQLMAVAGHSWHKFLGLRSRWASLGLEYTGKDDWQRREMTFLVQHLLTMVPEYACGDYTSFVPLTLVPLFVGSFDAANIEMAVGRAPAMRAVTWATLVDSLVACLDAIETKEQFTVLSLCWLTDRATHSRSSLALLASHGNNAQRFGVFPHNDPMFARMVAGSEGMWHEYTGLPVAQPIPSTPKPRCEESAAARAAFAYSQSGIRYTFFARLRGHFFEMSRDEEWVPTIKPASPRAVWAPASVARDGLLAVMRGDVEKVLIGMVELYGLRAFCHGFFDGLANGGRSSAATVSVSAAAAAAAASIAAMPVAPANPRRISDDPSFGSARRRNPSATASRLRRGRISTGAIATLGNTGVGAGGVAGGNGMGGGGSASASNSFGASPYRRPQSLAMAAGAGSTSATAAAAAARTLGHQSSYSNLGGAGLLSRNGNGSSASLSGLAPSAQQQQTLPFFSPQTRSYRSFPSSVDMSTMSASLPNSPFFGFPFDYVSQQQQQQQQQQQTPQHAPLMQQHGHAHNAASSTASHDSGQLFPPLSDAAFLAGSSTPSASFLADPPLNSSEASDAGGGLAAMTATSVAAAAAAAAAVAAAGIDTSTLLTGATIASSPAFWDFSSSGIQHQMQQASLGTPLAGSLNAPASGTISAMNSPNAQAVVAAAAAATAAVMGMAKNGSAGGSISSGLSPANSAASSTTARSVAIYPQPTTSALPLWDDTAVQSLSTVLGSPEMLMQFVQPSPTPTPGSYNNLTAHPTPAFEALSVPQQLLNEQIGSTLQTPLMAASGQMASSSSY
ncbi:hypothetical protein GGI07_002155 [Coemansia sp. Benny D115]|nr:hypothetical protein GGI07_002155 [Coemansia sp. Benny D115]